MALTRRNKGMSMCILITKLISYCIIFETNKYIYRNDYLRGCFDCKSDTRLKGGYKFL